MQILTKSEGGMIFFQDTRGKSYIESYDPWFCSLALRDVQMFKSWSSFCSLSSGCEATVSWMTTNPFYVYVASPGATTGP